MAPDRTELAAELDSALTTLHGAQTDWLARLVSFDSVRGNVAPCQEWLAREFAGRGWSVDSFTIDDVDIAGKPGYSPVVDTDYTDARIVVATHDVEQPAGRSLILQGHIDVVPPGAPELWPHPPFEPQVKDGWMSGRGTNDMKVGVAEMVFALDALRAVGYVPDARVHIQTVCEEECTGNGALATLERGYRADAALIPESLNGQLLRAELGSVWFRVRILGAPGHVLATAGPGANAILAGYDYAGDLANLTAEINNEARDHPWFGHIENPVKFSLGKIRGGDWLGSVPSWCEIECRMSVLPGTSLFEMRERVSACIAGTAKRLGGAFDPVIDWIGFQADGHVFLPGSDAEATLASVHEYVTGHPLETFSQTATSDTRQYDLYYGIPTLCYGGHGEGSHSPSERTNLASMQETTKIIALFIADWCGLRPV
ncbi:ArgE/DapE family deacylase [Pelagibacterium xiamenense]|uniref:ArgE/DapE family deacylase n=1 Tax=Pelagibacterium xiamenense TaxID=2901140 RepID=UPI001E417285|nr:ArgE/DapE family deacylase [Pelagibacterium xiamenense]MCD7061434.1 ArgE/DapE family deacylase [Pelagibacterium xiamenense]